MSEWLRCHCHHHHHYWHYWITSFLFAIRCSHNQSQCSVSRNYIVELLTVHNSWGHFTFHGKSRMKSYHGILSSKQASKLSIHSKIVSKWAKRKPHWLEEKQKSISCKQSKQWQNCTTASMKWNKKHVPNGDVRGALDSFFSLIAISVVFRHKN